MKQVQIRCILILAVALMIAMKVTGQNSMPDELTKNPLKEQLKYIEDRTRIFENYRAIREDIFQKMKDNVTDTLQSANGEIVKLNRNTLLLNRTIDSLRTSLDSTLARLGEMTRTKNSIKVIGLELNKLTYNKIMWTILAGLVAIMFIGIFLYYRNLSITSNTKKDYQELKDEFEAYRKTSREAREKLTRDHFNEIRKLKGG